MVVSEYERGWGGWNVCRCCPELAVGGFVVVGGCREIFGYVSLLLIGGCGGGDCCGGWCEVFCYVLLFFGDGWCAVGSVELFVCV